MSDQWCFHEFGVVECEKPQMQDRIAQLEAEVARLREAAQNAAMYLATGFIECDRCRHEVKTKHTDAEYELRQALLPKQKTAEGSSHD